jgi:hypothetical protein
MTRNVAKLALIALCGLAPLAGVGIANADPATSCGLHDPLLCDPTQVRYCPDTHSMVTWLQNCPSLTEGPYLPGNPSNGGNGDR